MVVCFVCMCWKIELFILVGKLICLMCMFIILILSLLDDVEVCFIVWFISVECLLEMICVIV